MSTSAQSALSDEQLARHVAERIFISLDLDRDLDSDDGATVTGYIAGAFARLRASVSQPDDARLREAFMAGIRAYRADDGVGWAFDLRVNARLWRDMVEAGEQEAYATWLSQRTQEPT